MRLVSKTTWCFFCQAPTWKEGVFEGTRKTDKCTSCGASKRVGLNSGILDYYNPQGVPCNFMTSDFRYTKVLKQRRKVPKK